MCEFHPCRAVVWRQWRPWGFAYGVPCASGGDLADCRWLALQHITRACGLGLCLPRAASTYAKHTDVGSFLWLRVSVSTHVPGWLCFSWAVISQNPSRCIPEGGQIKINQSSRLLLFPARRKACSDLCPTSASLSCLLRGSRTPLPQPVPRTHGPCAPLAEEGAGLRKAWGFLEAEKTAQLQETGKQRNWQLE